MNNVISRYASIYLITIWCLIPIFIFVFLSSPTHLPLGQAVPLIFGQLSGIIGTGLFTLSFILAARFAFIETLFYGLNNAYTWHRYLGTYAYILLLIHPLLIGFQYLSISLGLTGTFFFPPLSNYAEWFGYSSLFTLTLLLLFTFFMVLPYHIWNLTHQFLGISLVFGIFHIMLAKGVLIDNVLLRWYLIWMCLCALYAFLDRTVLFRLLVKRLRYRIVTIHHASNNVLEFSLKPIQKSLKFQPGQFVYLSIHEQGIAKEAHPFSMVSIPSDPNLVLIVKEVGDYTKTLNSLKEGTEVFLEGPFGRFLFREYKNKQQVWIAGGMGITPFVSMMRSLTSQDQYTIDFYYVTHSKDDAIYLSETLTFATFIPQVRIIPWFTKDQGHLDAKAVISQTQNAVEREYFFCAPPPMTRLLKKQLIATGIKAGHIHSEDFSFR